MQNITVLHVITRLNILDSNISDLREMLSSLKPNADYTDSIQISLEKQINKYLNEKNKLIVLPLEKVTEDTENILLPNHNNQQEEQPSENKNKSNFDITRFEDHHKTTQSKSEIFSNLDNVSKSTPSTSSSQIETSKIQKHPSAHTTNYSNKHIQSQFNAKRQKTLDTLKELSSLNLSREELLKKIPQVDY